MMNRKNMTASTLDETALDAYYTLTEGGANYTRCHSEQLQRGHDGCLSGCL